MVFDTPEESGKGCRQRAWMRGLGVYCDKSSKDVPLPFEGFGKLIVMIIVG